MTAILTGVQKADEMVKLAREQIDAFNKGDWDAFCENPRRRRPLRGVRNRAQGRRAGEDRRALQRLEDGISGRQSAP